MLVQRMLVQGMLVQQIVGAFGLRFVQRALRFSSAKPDTVGIGLFCGLFSFTALLEALQINQVPHVKTPSAGSARTGDMNKGTVALGVSLLDGHSRKSPFYQSPYVSVSDGQRRNASLCENKISCALSCGSAIAIANESQSLGVMNYNHVRRRWFAGSLCCDQPGRVILSG
jgi:hypothetical protein